MAYRERIGSKEMVVELLQVRRPDPEPGSQTAWNRFPLVQDHVLAPLDEP